MASYKPKSIQIENYLDTTVWVLAKVLPRDRVLHLVIYSQQVFPDQSQLCLPIPPGGAKAILYKNFSNYAIVNRCGFSLGHSWKAGKDILHLLIQKVRN